MTPVVYWLGILWLLVLFGPVSRRARMALIGLVLLAVIGLVISTINLLVRL